MQAKRLLASRGAEGGERFGESQDKVVLRRGTYELEIPNGGAGMDNGSLDFVDGVTLQGRGADETTIDANDLDQVVTTWNNGSAGTPFALRDLTLTGGDANAGFQNDGGAIVVGGGDDLDVRGVAMAGNRAPTSGGAIAAFGSADVVVRSSTISGNQAIFGGGIEFQGAELIMKQTIGLPATPRLRAEASTCDRDGTLPLTRIAASTIAANAAREQGRRMLVDGLPYSGGDRPEDPKVQREELDDRLQPREQRRGRDHGRQPRRDRRRELDDRPQPGEPRQLGNGGGRRRLPARERQLLRR